jgi:hypothetical protein
MFGAPVDCRVLSCQTQIMFGVTIAGNRMPINAAPDAGGNVIIELVAAGRPRLRVLTGQELPWQGTVSDRGPYIPHHRTCTEPARWRTGRRVPSTDPRPVCLACLFPMGRPGNTADVRVINDEGWTTHPACDPRDAAAAARAAIRHRNTPPDDRQEMLL